VYFSALLLFFIVLLSCLFVTVGRVLSACWPVYCVFLLFPVVLFFCSFPILVSVSGSVTVRLALLDFIQCQLAAYINTGPVDQELTQLLL
jgi:hypothetical protein